MEAEFICLRQKNWALLKKKARLLCYAYKMTLEYDWIMIAYVILKPSDLSLYNDDYYLHSSRCYAG